VQPVGEGTPVWRNFSFHNVLARGATTAGFLLGLLESPFSAVTFNNVRIWAEDEGLLCRYAKDVAFRDVQIVSKAGSALVCRDVEGLEIEGLRTGAPHPDFPVVDLSDVKDVFLRGYQAPRGTTTFVSARGDSTRNCNSDSRNRPSAGLRG
jgi:hypothetical protein